MADLTQYGKDDTSGGFEFTEIGIQPKEAIIHIHYNIFAAVFKGENVNFTDLCKKRRGDPQKSEKQADFRQGFTEKRCVFCKNLI